MHFGKLDGRTWLTLACGLSLLFGCIERPPSITEKRAKFDRSGLTGSVLLTSLPAPQVKLGAVFGEAAELVGADISPMRPKAGDAVEVVFYFRVLEEADEDYKVFIHIDDSEGRGDRINRDHFPADGKYQTTLWRKGEVVKDRWLFRVPGYMQGHTLDIWAGFYIPNKNDRWPVTNPTQIRNDGNNRVWAGSVTVE